MRVLERYPNMRLRTAGKKVSVAEFEGIDKDLRKSRLEGVAAGVVLLDGGKVALVKKSSGSKWSLPESRIKSGDDFDSGFEREARAKYGLEASVVDVHHAEKRFFLAPNDSSTACWHVYFTAKAKPGVTPESISGPKRCGHTLGAFHAKALPKDIEASAAAMVAEAYSRSK
jgi:ADP-ribose pyrophosphatase YjhB (NUDIX family)